MESSLTAYAARFDRMNHICGAPSWRYLFSGPEELAAARAAAASDPGKMPDLQRLESAVVHPDTGRLIPPPLRMAAHVPINTLLLGAMLSARSPVASAVAQAVNASFNAAQFYAQRHASNAVSDQALFASWVGAMSTSAGVSAALAAVSARRGGVGASQIAFLSAAAGKPLQIGAMRVDEWTDGVFVETDAGVVLGRSVAAGRLAVAETVVTRVLYLAPLLFLPLCTQAVGRRFPSLAGGWRGAGVLLTLSCLSSALFTPACLALFDQRAAVQGSALEPRFHGAGVVYYNKGL